jgi:hypothetical protein
MKHWSRGPQPCAAAAAMVTLLGACGADTGSERFGFDAVAGGAASATGAPLVFTNQTGWTITLTRADVTLGPVYLNVQPPLRVGHWLDWLVPPAFAQAAHLDEGRVAGEVLGQVTFSALSPELVPFPVTGTLAQEQVRTVEIWFYPRPGVAAETAAIDTVALDVAGEATRDGVAYPFEGQLVLDQDWVADQIAGTRGTSSITEIRQVRGVAADFFPVEGGRLELRLDIARLFRGANFASLEDNLAGADGVRRLSQAPASRDQVMNNLYLGLREANGTYAVSWVSP